MNPVLKKLQFKNPETILILNSPEEFSETLKSIPVKYDTAANGKYDFILAFAIDSKEAKTLISKISKVFKEDSYLWICYPKGTSKKYKSDLKRDSCATLFADKNLEPVTLVAIDEDWSAMRFKPVEKIKEMKRKTAVSAKGKKRIQSKNSK